MSALPSTSVSAESAADGRDRARFAVAASVALLDGMGAGVLLPLLPFLVLHFGGSRVLVTQLVAIYSLAGFVGSFGLGRISDRHGHARVLVISLGGTLLAYLGMLAAWSLAGVFVCRVFAGLLIGRAGVLRALATDGSPPDVQVRRIGWLAALAAIGTTIGPGLASLLAATGLTGVQLYRSTLMLAAGLIALTLVAALAVFRGGGQLPRATSGPTRSTAMGAVLRPLAALYALTFLTAYGQGVIMSVTALYGQARFGWGAGATGLTVAFIAAGLAVGRMLILPWSMRIFGPKTTLCASAATAAVSLGLLGLAREPALYLVGNGLFSAALGVAGVLPATLVSVRAPAGERGLALSANEGVVAIAILASAGTNGWWFDSVGPSAPYLAGAAVLAAAVPLALSRFPWPKASTV